MKSPKKYFWLAVNLSQAENTRSIMSIRSSVHKAIMGNKINEYLVSYLIFK